MNTATVTIPRQGGTSISDTSLRLTGLIKHCSNVAQWWVDLTGQLDELSTRLMTDSEQMWRGLREQLTRDVPHMAAAIRRIDAEQEALEDDLLRVRILAGEAAGDQGRMRAVADAVRALLNRVRRLEERTTQALYDAYERDLGGEAA
jgi:hypothetical protein